MMRRARPGRPEQSDGPLQEHGGEHGWFDPLRRRRAQVSGVRSPSPINTLLLLPAGIPWRREWWRCAACGVSIKGANAVTVVCSTGVRLDGQGDFVRDPPLPCGAWNTLECRCRLSAALLGRPVRQHRVLHVPRRRGKTFHVDTARVGKGRREWLRSNAACVRDKPGHVGGRFGSFEKPQRGQALNRNWRKSGPWLGLVLCAGTTTTVVFCPGCTLYQVTTGALWAAAGRPRW
jgi:hypothetical protein